MKKFLNYFTTIEKILWCSSVFLIITSFMIFDRENYLTLFASMVGVTSLIFCAKGNPIGQVLMVIFSIVYGIISYSFAYYGEMITYLGMSGPMALFALIAWLKNPYKGKKSQVKVNKISKNETTFMLILSVLVTILFYFILKNFGTANLIPSTISITTSFIAVYLTFRRSPYFAFVYAINDLVLIVLWTLATLTDINYMSVLICFIVFFINDIYGFISWLRMEKSQKSNM